MAVAAAEAVNEVAVVTEELLEAVAFVTELGALIEEWLGAVGEFIEGKLSSGDVVGHVGDRVACAASVESAAGGEVALRLAVSVLCCFEVVGDVRDGPVVRGAAWGQLSEALVEYVDPMLDACDFVLFGFNGGPGVGECPAGVVSEIVEPVGDHTSRQ